MPIARALKLPLVVTFHGGDATKTKHYRKALVPTVFQRRSAALQREAALIICVAEHIRDALIGHNFPPAKLRVIRYGIDPEAETDTPEPAEHPYLLFAGRFVEKKGIGHLLDAMRILKAGGAAPSVRSTGSCSSSSAIFLLFRISLCCVHGSSMRISVVAVHSHCRSPAPSNCRWW